VIAVFRKSSSSSSSSSKSESNSSSAPKVPQKLETVWKAGADGVSYPTLRPASSDSGKGGKK